MKKKLFQRVIAMTLCLVMSVTMFPLSVFAAPKEANITFHMAYLDNGQLVSATYDDESKGTEYKYDRAMYIRFTWPINTQELEVMVEGPVSGTLYGYAYRDHVENTGSMDKPVYVKTGMTETSILSALSTFEPGNYMSLQQTFAVSKDGKTNSAKAPGSGSGGANGGNTANSGAAASFAMPAASAPDEEMTAPQPQETEAPGCYGRTLHF